MFLLRTRQIHFTGKVADPGDRVVATQVSFARQMGGVPFVGGGSRVHLVIGAGDMPSLVHVDWPGYSTTGYTQKIVNVERFDLRIAGMRDDTDVEPIAGSLTVGIVNMMCGYFDPSAKSDEIYAELACEVALATSGPDMPALQGILVPLGDGASLQQFWGGEEGLALLEQRGGEPSNACIVERHVKLEPGE